MIIELYCPDESTYITQVPGEIADILHKLWELFDLPLPFALEQMKIYTLALFSVLLNLRDIPKSQVCAFFTETQVDIAEQVGYLNQSKFATVFKKQFGLSPLEYRRSRALENLK